MRFVLLIPPLSALLSVLLCMQLRVEERVLLGFKRGANALDMGTCRSHAMRMVPEGCWPSLSAAPLAGGKRSALP